jgi:hypothetical protein
MRVEALGGKERRQVARRYLAFDIETAKEVPGADFNWKPHRPLGISCAAALAGGSDEPTFWFGKTPEGLPAGHMSRDEARGLIRYLQEMTADGFTVLTWNGLGFDFDVLAEESGDLAACAECALGHVDMMFHVVCTKGYPVGLDKAAQGMGLPGKPPGMSGIKAPGMWAEGRFKEVLDYVAQDVRAALQIAEACERDQRLTWITRKGKPSTMPLGRGWLTVREAMRLPEPDTSWMTNPLPRSEFTGWLPSG